jgi:hypothetical protein
LTRASTNQHVILITIDGLGAYYLSDPQASLPTLRKLAAEGASAEGLRVSNPSVTWPNHTTLVTGVHPEKHSVLFNGVLVRPGAGESVKIEGARDKSDLVAVPTLTIICTAPAIARRTSIGPARVARKTWMTVFQTCPTRSDTSRRVCARNSSGRGFWTTLRTRRSAPRVLHRATRFGPRRLSISSRLAAQISCSCTC